MSAGWPMTYSNQSTGNAVTFAAPCALGYEPTLPPPACARLDLPAPPLPADKDFALTGPGLSRGYCVSTLAR